MKQEMGMMLAGLNRYKQPGVTACYCIHYKEQNKRDKCTAGRDLDTV
jgi:hypothetical protein